MSMRFFTLIISFFLTTNIFGQSSDSLNIDNNIALNRQEINFLNTALKSSRDTFDFADKKIAFVTGSSGSKLISKQDYFLTCVKPSTDKGSMPQISFVHLTPEEKQNSKGYDAIVMSWVKVFTNKQRKKIIEQLSKTR
jgi:hypothetical protein